MDVQRISEEQKRKINAKLKLFGLEMVGCSVTGNKASVSINKGCATTFNRKKVAQLLKNSFGTNLSAVIVDGVEIAV